MSKKAIVILSGGQDSTVCAYMAKSQGYELHAITFDYGQRHRIEIDAAREIAALVGCASHEVIDIGPGVLRGTSPLVSDEPLEQYADHASLPGGLEKTFVPMRNQLFLTIAANRAYVIGARTVIIGVSGDDFEGYPDCRPAFIRALTNASNLGTFTGGDLDIRAPLMAYTKASTVGLSLAFPGCYAAMAWTHTSYDGAYPPTGKDHATLLRAKGFEDAGLPDPLVIRAHDEGLMPLPATRNYSGEVMRYARAKMKEIE